VQYFVMPFVQLCTLLPSTEWVWSATYVTRPHDVSTHVGLCGLHAITAVSAASLTTQSYVSEAQLAFKKVCGEDADFLRSMPTEEEEEEAAAAVVSHDVASAESSSAASSNPAFNYEESSS
jgi:hypothetical protein